MAPGEHLHKNYAQRPNVGALINRFAENLLGSHVGEGPGRRETLRGASAGHHTGEPKVHNFSYIVFCDDDVGRFNIAVDDVLRVSRAQATGNLDGKVQRVADRSRPA